MVELDYAFFADYAKVEPSGTLTTVGASWTFMSAPSVPVQRRIAVAGRVRSTVDAVPIAIRLEIGPDGASPFLKADFALGSDVSNLRPYGDGRIGHLFAADASVLLEHFGTYRASIYLNGDLARVLKFEVLREGG